MENLKFYIHEDLIAFKFYPEFKVGQVREFAAEIQCRDLLKSEKIAKFLKPGADSVYFGNGEVVEKIGKLLLIDFGIICYYLDSEDRGFEKGDYVEGIFRLCIAKNNIHQFLDFINVEYSIYKWKVVSIVSDAHKMYFKVSDNPYVLSGETFINKLVNRTIVYPKDDSKHIEFFIECQLIPDESMTSNNKSES